MMKPKIIDAIRELVGGRVSGPVDSYKPNLWDGQKLPSKSKIDSKLADLVTDWGKKEYIMKREIAYPPIGDQLDDLYHKGAFSTEMAAKLKKVKDDFPKG